MTKSRHEAEYEEVKDEDTEVVYGEIPDAIGPHAEQAQEVDLVGLLYAREAMKAEEEGFEAVQIAYFLEPGMRAARELHALSSEERSN